MIPYPFIIILQYKKYREWHRVIKLKTIYKGTGFKVLHNIHFRFGKRRNISNFFALHYHQNNQNMVISIEINQKYIAIRKKP